MKKTLQKSLRPIPEEVTKPAIWIFFSFLKYIYKYDIISFKYMIKLDSKNFFVIGVFAVILLATVLRFYNYDLRWQLAYDQAHDALIARYAVAQMQLPLLGPFSSAGAFQTGGEWYWIVMLGTILFPFTVNGPWIFMTFLYVLFVFLI